MRVRFDDAVLGLLLAILVLAMVGLVAATIARAKAVDECLHRGLVPVEIEGRIGCVNSDGRLLGRGVDTPGIKP